jgi:hypothetical protein
MNIHSKFHRKNHHTDIDPYNPDAGHDPIASKTAPFQGDFFLNGCLSSNKTISALSFHTLGTSILDNSIANTLTANYLFSKQLTLSAINGITPLIINQYGTGPALIVNDQRHDDTPFIIDADGKLGIGTTKPDASISLSSFNTTGALHIQQIAAAGYAIKVDDASNDSTPFIIDNGGNVGIGKAAPTQKLDVVGNAYITGNVGINAAPNSGATLSLNGTLSSNNAIFINKFAVTVSKILIRRILIRKKEI